MDSTFDPQYLAIGGGMKLSPENPLVTKFIELSSPENSKSKITILPTASSAGEEVGNLYLDIFSEFVDDTEYYIIENRADTENKELINALKESTGIFFTGGDQLKITSLLGGSRIMKLIRKAKQRGAFIAGTSAGASAMSDTMISWGPADEMLKGDLKMSPGIGLVNKAVIDSHFVKRGRISRLLHLIAQNPGVLGIGLSEDTGILIDVKSTKNMVMEVIGSRQVIIVDGRQIRHANIAQIKEKRPFAVTDVKLHTLTHGYRYSTEEHSIQIPEKSIDIEEPAEPSEMPYRPLVGEDNEF